MSSLGRHYLHRFVLLSVVLLQFGSLAGAHSHDDDGARSGGDGGPERPIDICAKVLTKNHDVIWSGRQGASEEAELQQAIDEIFSPGGVAQQLGFALPPHRIEFVPSTQLSLLASIGRHPVGHWHDGHTLATKASTSMGILEFVTPGCPTCRSFYTDTMSPTQQLSILFHVAGHNDVAAHSMWQLDRSVDPIAESMKLYQLMERLYVEVDHDEVSLWYQYLLSLVYAQDLARGTFHSPESLSPDAAPGIGDNEHQHVSHQRSLVEQLTGLTSPFSKNPYAGRVHPKVPTPSELQFVVANLPPGTPSWKRQMAVLFERINRVYGEYATQKIINEGWATMAQEILAGHSRFSTVFHDLEYADLLMGVAGHKALSNPYWFGREGWRRIRARFNKRPEIQGLAPLPRDQAFVAHAHSIIQVTDDFQFVRLAFDRQFVEDHKLYIHAPLPREEWDPNLPQPPSKLGDPPLEQKRILTRDPEPVSLWLAHQVADRTRQIPRVFVENSNAFGRGIYHLRQDLQDYQAPLMKEDMAQALFVRAQMMQKPASLDTVGAQSWGYFNHLLNIGLPPIQPFWNYDWSKPGEHERYVREHEEYWRQMARYNAAMSKERLFPIRVEVAPSGEVHAFDKIVENGEEREQENPELTAVLKDAVQVFREDIAASVNQDLADIEIDQFKPSITSVADFMTNSPVQMLTHTPTAGRALLEYYAMIEKRLMRAIERAVLGKQKFKVNGNRIRLQVLPKVPTFDFDRKVASRLSRERKRVDATPEDDYDLFLKQRLSTFYSARQHGSTHLISDGAAADAVLKADIQGFLSNFLPTMQTAKAVGSQLNPQDGDLGEGPGGEGDIFWGPGDPDGEGEPGTDPGDEPMDPTELEIPLELWAEFLKEYVELPRLKPKDTGDVKKEEVRTGGRHNPVGQRLYTRMMPNVLALGQASLKEDGIKPEHMLPLDVIQRGFQRIQPSHYIVRGTHTSPVPDIKAVVTFTMDMSGSMWGYIPAAKEFMFNLEALLRLKYKHITFRYIAFDTVAHVFESKEAFFKSMLGGGTDYSVGLKKTKEVLESFPPAQYDRYSFTIGDAGDGNPPASLEAFRELYESTEYSAYVQMGTWGVAAFLEPVKQMSQEEEFFGYAEYDHEMGNGISVLKDLFKKKE